MSDTLVEQAIRDGDDDRIRAVLADVCALTDMGFAAVALVTEDRWIACQVVDKIEFGLTPGGELKVQTTICNEIREHHNAVVFDDATVDTRWREHPVPVLYGFKSYAAFPLFLPDGTFYGTLCAIDPVARKIAVPDVIAALKDCAARVADILASQLLLRATERAGI